MAAGGAGGGLLLLPAVLLHPGVLGFSFPSDWYKIRQMMEERRRKEELGMRWGGEVEFVDEYDDLAAYREREWETTSRPPPPATAPVTLDPVLEEMMRTVNWTEMEIRFGGGGGPGLAVRGAFGAQVEAPPPPPYQASDSVWEFTLAMVRQGLRDPASGNSLFSPISVLTTINMLLLGTRGETKAEVLRALGYPRYTAQVHGQFQHILGSMARDIGVTVVTSNALFTQVNFPIKESYKEDLRRHYGDKVHIVPVDFASRPRTTLRRINGFIAASTNGMIRNMFSHPVAPGTKAVVSNCLYFNGTWEYEFPFEPGYDEGRNDTFHTFRAGKTMTYMAGKLDFPYYRNSSLGLEILSLPYEHGERSEEISEAHMFLVKPTAEGEAAYTQLERSFSHLHFQEIFQRMQPAYGLVELPRMKMEFQANLRDVLGSIGIHRMFSGNTSRDFSPLTGRWGDLVLDTLQHKAVLKITEKGTEAAAATAAVQFYLGPMFTVTFDRPFFLFIYDALNKVVIFWGRVVEPEPIFLPLSTPL